MAGSNEDEISNETSNDELTQRQTVHRFILITTTTGRNVNGSWAVFLAYNQPGFALYFVRTLYLFFSI